MKNNDAQLIQRTLDADDAAFAKLVEKYQKQVHTLVWRKIGDFHFAEEITQDTFLKAYQQLRTLRKPQRFASWLYVIASNLCGTWLRNQNIRTQLQQDIDNTVTERLTYSEYVVTENNRVIAETQRDVVKKLLAKLGESERTIMTLHYFGEMSCPEIGAFLGVSANTVKSRLRRAQQRLKKEEPMIREALDNFKITPNLTDTIMREISRTKPATPSGSNPLVPWAVAFSTLAVVLLMLGFGSHQYLERFQKPYSFDATAEMTVDIVEAPLVANLESKPDVRTQIGNIKALDKQNNPDLQSNDAPAANAEPQTDDTVQDYTKWELPKEAKARFGKGGINAMQFSPDGTQLAVGSNIGVWLYNVKTGKEVSMFPGMCQSLAFSPNGRYLVNGGGKYGLGGRFRGNELQLWEVATGRKVPYTEVLPPATAVYFSEDSNTLVSMGNWRDTIGILNVETGQMNLKNIPMYQKSINHPQAYALAQDKFAIGRDDGMVDLWDVMSVKRLSTLNGHSEQVPAMIQEKRKQDMVGGVVQREIGNHNHPTAGNHVSALAFSPDGTQLASGSMNTTVRLLDITREDEPITLIKHTGWVNVLAYSPDGKVLASGSTDKTVLLWDTTSGKLLATFKSHVNGITALTFSPDGKTLASASIDGTVLFWNTETGNELPTPITGHTDWVRDVSFVKDSTTIVSVAFNGAITYWDMKTSQKTVLQMSRYQDILQSVAFSHDGTKLVSVGAKGDVLSDLGSGVSTSRFMSDKLIRLTDVSTGRELSNLAEEGGSSTAAFSPDGKTVAVSDSGKIQLWNTETGTSINIPLSDLDFAQGVVQKHSFHIPDITALVFSADGNKLVGGNMGGKVQMWDAVTGVALAPFLKGQDMEKAVKKNGKQKVNPNNLNGNVTVSVSVSYNDPITVLAFSPSGALLAVGSERKIRLLGIKKQIGFEEVPHGAKSLVFSPESNVLVSGLRNGEIELWDLETGIKLTTLDGHSEPVETLIFSPDGNTLVSTGQDGTILVWDWNEAIKSSDR